MLRRLDLSNVTHHRPLVRRDDYALINSELSGEKWLLSTESCFRHPLFDLLGTGKVEIRHTNFHFSSKKVTSKSRKVEVFDLTIVKKLSTFRLKKAKVEKLKSRKVEKLKS